MLTDGIANPHWPNYLPWFRIKRVVSSVPVRGYRYCTYGNLTCILAVTLHNGAPYPNNIN